MPEGPEIHRLADRLRKVLEHRVAEDVYFAFERLEPFAAVLQQRRVEGVRARGKALLIEFEEDFFVYSHLQLYGRWYVRKRGGHPNTGRQLRFAIDTGTHSALLYSASEIQVLERSELPEHPFLKRLGPDILDPELDAAALRKRLRDKAFRRRQLGALYLDQSFLGGLGNYLRAEILFRARVHPCDRVEDLAAAAVRRLATETLAICRRSYESGGITLPARMTKRLEGERQLRRRRRFWVYGRGGWPCRVCAARVERIDVGGRHIYVCPECQPRERS